MHKHITIAVVAAAAVGWALASFFGDNAALVHIAALMKVLFLGALKLIIAPLVFFSLISGVLRLGEASRMTELGAWTVGYYLMTTLIAIGIGLVVVTFIHPWTSSPPLANPPPVPEGVTFISAGDDNPAGILGGLLKEILVNPFTALANTNLLAIVANGIAIGLAALLVLPAGSRIPEIVHEITQVVYKLAEWAILLVPVGVLAIVYELTLASDTALIGQLVTFCMVVFLATAFHGLVVLPTIARLFAGKSLRVLFDAVAEPFTVALTTSSSAATLPVSLRAANERLNIDPSVSSFVLPLGATMNMDGTALFEAVAAVFLAYLFGIELDSSTIVLIFVVTMLASVGAPGIPSGSMAGMQVVLLSLGIPLEAIGILLLVERPLDTFRTAVNVEGDLIGCIVVDHRLRAAQPGVPE